VMIWQTILPVNYSIISELLRLLLGNNIDLVLLNINKHRIKLNSMPNGNMLSFKSIAVALYKKLSGFSTIAVQSDTL
jgi:hypothetical protein